VKGLIRLRRPSPYRNVENLVAIHALTFEVNLLVCEKQASSG
jgi:hypothetical protein